MKLPLPQQKISLHIMVVLIVVADSRCLQSLFTVVADITFFTDINISNISVLKYSGWESALVADSLLRKSTHILKTANPICSNMSSHTDKVLKSY